MQTGVDKEGGPTKMDAVTAKSDHPSFRDREHRNTSEPHRAEEDSGDVGSVVTFEARGPGREATGVPSAGGSCKPSVKPREVEPYLPSAIIAPQDSTSETPLVEKLVPGLGPTDEEARTHRRPMNEPLVSLCAPSTCCTADYEITAGHWLFLSKNF